MDSVWGVRFSDSEIISLLNREDGTLSGLRVGIGINIMNQGFVFEGPSIFNGVWKPISLVKIKCGFKEKEGMLIYLKMRDIFWKWRWYRVWKFEDNLFVSQMNVCNEVAVWESLKINLGLLIILWYSIFPLQRRNELLYLLLGIFEASGVEKGLIFSLSCDWKVVFGWIIWWC